MSNKEPVIVTIQDARDAGLCVIGLRDWFNAHGLSFKDFLTHGVAADRLPKNDCMCALAVAKAKERLLNENKHG